MRSHSKHVNAEEDDEDDNKISYRFLCQNLVFTYYECVKCITAMSSSNATGTRNMNLYVNELTIKQLLRIKDGECLIM